MYDRFRVSDFRFRNRDTNRLPLYASMFCVFTLALFPAILRAEAQPRRIVSLTPSITEALFQLGAADDVVGVTTFCQRPAEATRKQKIGTVMEPNIEMIVSLRPDLVLATETNPRRHIERLASLGLRVITLRPEKSFEDVCRNFALLGRVLGVEENASRIINQAKRQVANVKNRLKGVCPTKVFWELGSSPLVTAGKDTFADELVSLAGGINIAHDAPTRYVRYSQEDVVRQDPEAIILITMGDVTTREAALWKNYQHLKAVKNGRIYVIEAHSVCSPTPLTFARSLDMVARFLHPEVYRK